jgi:hypothetical protein
MKTRRLAEPWPFLYSVVSGRLVENLPARPKRPRLTRLRRLPPPSEWKQEALL